MGAWTMRVVWPTLADVEAGRNTMTAATSAMATRAAATHGVTAALG